MTAFVQNVHLDPRREISVWRKRRPTAEQYKTV